MTIWYSIYRENYSPIDAVLYLMKFFYKGILEKVGNGKYTSYKYTDIRYVFHEEENA